MDVKFRKTHAMATVPTYGTDGAGCFDLYAVVDDPSGRFVWVDTPQIFRTGLAFEVPEGYVMLIFSRSGHGFKNNARLSNCVGVIDSDFRGEVQVKLTVDPAADVASGLLVTHKMRIAQAMLVPIPKVSFIPSDTLSDTDRGEGGFGSTGA